jgi:predicted outer membrane repeat protein
MTDKCFRVGNWVIWDSVIRIPPRRRRSARRTTKPPIAARYETQALESRVLLSTYSVSNLADSGPGSLRQAITAANAHPGADTITFAAGLTGAITLTSAELAISDDLTISGPGANNLAVSGNNANRVFGITSGTVAISGLTIRNGFAPDSGGGILSSGTLTVASCTFSGNSAYLSGGGINANGTLTVANCTFSGNSAYYGGGVCDNGGGMTITNCTLSGNSANTGGGVFTNQGSLTIGNTIVAGNTVGPGGTGPDAGGSVMASNGHNLFGSLNGVTGWVASDKTGTDASPLDPKLGLLADNGGPPRPWPCWPEARPWMRVTITWLQPPASPWTSAACRAFSAVQSTLAPSSFSPPL